MKNAVTWFEIPVTDLDRAVRFYETVLAVPLARESFMNTPHAMFPFERPGGVGGALVRDEKRLPAAGGGLVYLDVSGKLDACLARVAAAGGTVLLPRTPIGDPGFIAQVRDTEGNTVGLHSPT
jgi:predicted enzyme related to lactoylglutathione lyase